MITKLAQAREALEAKREEEQARLEVRRKNFEFSTFSKKIRRKRKKCRREKESRPEESAGVKHNKKLNIQILPMVKYWCFKILCLDHPKVVTV